MNPVIGLDIATGESQVQAFLARKQPFGKTFKFKHDTNGLRDFYVFYKEVNYVQLKLQFQTILDQVFPEYKGVFGTLYSQVSLKTLLLYPTSDAVLKATTDDIASVMHSLGGKRSYAWFWDKANKLKEAAERKPFNNY